MNATNGGPRTPSKVTDRGNRDERERSREDLRVRLRTMSEALWVVDSGGRHERAHPANGMRRVVGSSLKPNAESNPSRCMVVFFPRHVKATTPTARLPGRSHTRIFF
jgi:hypothetical protein